MFSDVAMLNVGSEMPQSWPLELEKEQDGRWRFGRRKVKFRPLKLLC